MTSINDLPTFEDRALRIIHLAKEWIKESEADFPPGRSVPISDAIDKGMKEVGGEEPPHERALYEALHELSEKDVRKIEVLFYCGYPFNEKSVREEQQTLSRDEHGVMATRLATNPNLADFLEKGLAIAKREGVDLESDF